MLAVLTPTVKAVAEPLGRELAEVEPGRVYIVAHRGDWRDYPENSLQAIESCIRMGLAMAEIDLARTKDGHLVLMHDSTVDRTTTGRGKVADLTLVEIQALRLKNGYGVATTFGVPTLQEALQTARGRIRLNLDKSYRYFREMMPLLDEAGMTDQVLMKGEKPVAEVMAEHADLLARVAYMPVIDYRKPGAQMLLREWLDAAKPCAVEMVFPEWRGEVLEGFALCRDRGVRIWVNVLWPEIGGGLSDDLALTDPDAVYGLLLARGVSLFQTDRPRLLQAYLARRTPDTGK